MNTNPNDKTSPSTEVELKPRNYRNEILELLEKYPRERLKPFRYKRKPDELLAPHFWSQVSIGDPGGCWLWTGSTHPVGNRDGDVYGRPSMNGKFVMAHRWAFEWAKGEIPEKLVVRHTCDQHLCCNPAHLIPGTPADNMRDAQERNRIPRGDQSSFHLHPESVPRGEDNHFAKLSALEVLVIFWLYFGGMASVPILARLFKITEPQMNGILREQSWRHIKKDINVTPQLKKMLSKHYAKISIKKRAGRRLSVEQIRHIKLMIELGWLSYKEIAKKFDIDVSQVSRIARGQMWGNIW